MIEILNAPDNVAAFRLAGTVSERDYDELVREVESKLGVRERIGVYVDATDFERMTLPALRKRLRYGAKNWKQRRRFQRAALVTNKRWLESLTRVTNKIVPQMEARTFKRDESDAALRWVATGELS